MSVNQQLRGTVFIVEPATEHNQAHGEVIDYEARVFTLEQCETPEEFQQRVRGVLHHPGSNWRLEFGPIGAPWSTAPSV